MDRNWVYKALWFEHIMLLLAINFLGNIKRYKLFHRNRWPMGLFHISFVLIILAAGITRYFGNEGILAFSSIVMTSFGVNYYLSGLHSYAKGDPVPVPAWVYWAVAMLLIISLAAIIRFKGISNEERKDLVAWGLSGIKTAPAEDGRRNKNLYYWCRKFDGIVSPTDRPS